jgi:hypothetical protein
MSYFSNAANDIQLVATQDNNFDLLFEDGDIVIRMSNGQHIQAILSSEKGNWREHPMLGVGIQRYLNSLNTYSEITELSRKIRLQLEADGMQVGKLELKTSSKNLLNIDIIATHHV